jgi:hypothetical protein
MAHSTNYTTDITLHTTYKSVLKSKGKIVPVLVTKHHAMKGYWGMDMYVHEFLTSALDGGE